MICLYCKKPLNPETEMYDCHKCAYIHYACYHKIRWQKNIIFSTYSQPTLLKYLHILRRKLWLLQNLLHLQFLSSFYGWQESGGVLSHWRCGILWESRRWSNLHSRTTVRGCFLIHRDRHHKPQSTYPQSLRDRGHILHVSYIQDRSYLSIII